MNRSSKILKGTGVKMKNIFKKNQIIITALAIMIAIAGYLNFTGNDRPEKNKGIIETTNPDLENFDVLSEIDGTTLVQNDTEVNDETTVDDETAVDDEATDEIGTTAVDDDAKAQTTPVEEAGVGELGDISDEDILQTAQTVKDSGELDIKDKGVPGEAVLASTTINSSFFSTAKLSREQTRARNKATLMEIIENASVTEGQKQTAINHMIELTAIAEKENATEILLEAKGFDGAVVSIIDGSVDVVINASGISDQQIAIIEDVVKRKTNAKAEDIVITPVIVNE